MNARYVITETPAGMGEHFGLTITDNFPARYNVAPSQPVPIIRQGREGADYSLVRWGFVPAWDRKGDFFKRAMVNIRSETAHEKPSFKNAWRRRHCLFPMNGAYEWLAEDGGKQPYLIALDRSMPTFALAGLWEDWMGEDGAEMTTAAFLTREATGPLRQLHHRMPVFMPPDRYADWLAADELDETGARDIIGLNAPDMTWWKISRRVNSWKPDDAGLIEEVA